VERGRRGDGVDRAIHDLRDGPVLLRERRRVRGGPASVARRDAPEDVEPADHAAEPAVPVDDREALETALVHRVRGGEEPHLGTHGDGGTPHRLANEPAVLLRRGQELADELGTDRPVLRR
jgi:hypothetical protein